MFIVTQKEAASKPHSHEDTAPAKTSRFSPLRFARLALASQSVFFRRFFEFNVVYRDCHICTPGLVVLPPGTRYGTRLAGLPSITLRCHCTPMTSLPLAFLSLIPPRRRFKKRPCCHYKAIRSGYLLLIPSLIPLLLDYWRRHCSLSTGTPPLISWAKPRLEIPFIYNFAFAVCNYERKSFPKTVQLR